MELILKNVRLSFPDLWKPGNPPKDKPNEPGKYGGQFIFAPDHAAFEQVKQAVLAEAQRVFGANWQTILGSLQKDKKCLRVGDQNLDREGKVRDGYAGQMYVVAKNKLQPVILARGFRNGRPVEVRENGTLWQNGVQIEGSAKAPYGGCYVNAKIDVYAMDGSGKGFGKSVNATLLAVQFCDDGAAFGGSRPNAEGLEDMGGDEDAFGEPSAPTSVKDPLFG